MQVKVMLAQKLSDKALKMLQLLLQTQISDMDLSENSKWTIEHKLSFLLRYDLPFEEYLARDDLILVDVDVSKPIFASDADAGQALQIVNDPAFSVKNRESEMVQAYYQKVVKVKAVCLGLAGTYFDHLQLFDAGESCYLKYVELVENNYGVRSQVASNAYYALGGYYFKRGLHKKPLMCYQRAGELRAELLGEGHQAVIHCLIGELAVLVHSGQVDQGLALFRLAEAAILKHLGNLNIPLAKLHHLGSRLHAKIGDQEKAFTHIETAKSTTTKLSHSISTERGLGELRLEEEALLAKFDNENFAEYFKNFKESFSMFEVMRRTTNS